MYQIFKKWIITIIGGIIVGLNCEIFLKPARLAPGGVTGISVILNHLYDTPIWFSIVIINIPIFILGYFNYGKKYTIFSLIGMFSSAIASFAIENLFPNLKIICHDLMLFSVFSGTLMGFAGGITIVHNSGTGGTDILAKVLKKKVKNLTIGKAALIINFLIISMNGIIFKNFEVILYSLISLFIQSKVVDVINEGINYSKIAFIISDRNKEISEFIINELHRGVTRLYGKSMYTNHNKNIIMSVIKKQQINRLKTYIRINDPQAFIILSDSREVLGRGFDKP